ncbi:MAG: hypothetical protein V1808_01745 [Candidatus Daviesbacteria bacterium]
MKRRRLNYKPLLGKRQEKRARRRLLIVFFVSIILLYSFFTWFFPSLVGGLSILNRFKPTSQAQAPVSESATLAPPVLNIPYEATSSAQISINGYSVPKSQVEIYLDDELATTTDVREDGSFNTEPISLKIGTNNIFGKTLEISENNEVSKKSLPSKVIKVFFDNEKPKLEIAEPQDNQTVNGERKINISGQTDDDNITVTINGTRAVVNQEGNFLGNLELSDGENNITISATDLAGNDTSVSRKVTFIP